MWFDILLYLSNINNAGSQPTLRNDLVEYQMYDFGRLYLFVFVRRVYVFCNQFLVYRLRFG